MMHKARYASLVPASPACQRQAQLSFWEQLEFDPRHASSWSSRPVAPGTEWWRSKAQRTPLLDLPISALALTPVRITLRTNRSGAPAGKARGMAASAGALGHQPSPRLLGADLSLLRVNRPETSFDQCGRPQWEAHPACRSDRRL